MTQNRTLSLILPAFGAAIIAALAQIVIPIGAVPLRFRLLLLDWLLPSLNPERLLLLPPSTLSQALLVFPFLQEVAVGSKPSLVLQLAICLPTHFLHLSHLHWLMLRLLSGRSFWLLFWEMHLSLSVVSLACTFLESMGWSAAVAVGLTPFIIPDFKV